MSFIFDIAAARQAKAAGKYNKSVQERNAKIAEQEAAQIEKQNEFDIDRFDQQFVKLQGQTKTAIIKSGATLEGSGLRAIRYNAEQAEIQKNVMTYNSKVVQSQKLEEANFARIKGTIAEQQAKVTELGYYAKAGQSLLALA
jgi:hypothetical protein